LSFLPLSTSFRTTDEQPTNQRNFYYSQTFHNYFLKGLETARAFTKTDTEMKRDKRLGSAALVAIATIASSIGLSACGADDSAPPATSSTTSSSSSQVNAAHDAVQQGAPASIAAFAPTASGPSALPALPAPSAPFAADPAAASDPVAQTMQANLAADNQQIAPVMHYAPGDGASSN
jgi:hypothetical protein